MEKKDTQSMAFDDAIRGEQRGKSSPRAVGYSVVDGTSSSSNVTRQHITPLGSEFTGKEGRRRRRTITLVTSNNDSAHNHQIHTTHAAFIGFRFPLGSGTRCGRSFRIPNEFHEPHAVALVGNSSAGNLLVEPGTFPTFSIRRTHPQ